MQCLLVHGGVWKSAKHTDDFKKNRVRSAAKNQIDVPGNHQWTASRRSFSQPTPNPT
jgi:hypothetical protein